MSEVAALVQELDVNRVVVSKDTSDSQLVEWAFAGLASEL